MIITIAGYYGFANAGDEAILAGMLRQLRGHAPDLRIRVICGDVPATEREHGVEAVYWQNLTAIGRAIETSDLLLIGGGGLFHDYWGCDPDTLLTGKHWGISFYASCAFIAHLHRKPVMLHAVGVGPLLSVYGKRLTHAVCKIASRISVRDEGSRALLLSLGVSPNKVRLTADPAFSVQPPVPLTYKGKQPVLGACIRRWSFGVYPEFLEREIALALDYFIDETGGSVLFIPFQSLAGGIEDDSAAARRVLDRMTKAKEASIWAGAGWTSCYRAIQGCDVLLGMRLHSVIFSALARIPCVVVSYDPKLNAIAQQLGPTTPMLDVTGLDASDLNRAIVAALESGVPNHLRPEPFQESNAEDAQSAISLAGSEPLGYSLSDDQVELLSRGLRSLHRELDDARLELKARDDLFKAHDALNEKARSLLLEVSAAKQSRLQLYTAIDEYRDKLRSDLAAFRSQKAWQAMLAIRKAYTLLRRSKLEFLRFLLGAATYQFGSLAEYDLPFPDIRQFTGVRSEPETEAPTERSPVPPQTTTYDVIVLAIIDFDFRFQRPQQIAVEMARQGHRIFWVSPSRFLPKEQGKSYKIQEIAPNIWEVHARCAALDVYNGELSPAALTELVGSLTDLLVETGSADTLVYVQLPFWRQLALQLRDSFGSKILYDCMDDWDTFQNMGSFNVQEEEKLARECDILVVTGEEIERKFLARSLRPVLVRNGVDFDFFSTAETSALLQGLPHPIIGYFGAIADWIDLRLVEQAAISRPQYTFVLIGQVFNRDTHSLQSLPNVRLLGGKPYDQIPSYLYLFDACIIPFLLNPVTRATDPVKLYEYLSLGKPVVATEMAELARCADLIYIARDPTDFAQKLDLAVSESGDTLADARIAFAKTNTWVERVNTLDSNIRSLFPLVSILIVTHDSEEFVAACIDSILSRTAYPNYEIVLVDNASADGTASLLESYSACSSRVFLSRLTENTGFAAGNNHAARLASGEYLVFLNIDTIVTAGWIHRLLRHVQKDPSLGLICPVTNFAGNEVKIDFSYDGQEDMENFAADVAVRNRGKELDIQTAPLFCALTPLAVWKRVGDLDVTFGMGMFEDDDFSVRVRRAGFRVASAEDCFIHHFGQGSFAKLPSEVYNELFRTNQRKFEEKWGIRWQPHRPRPGARPLSQEIRFRPASFCRAPATPIRTASSSWSPSAQERP